MRATRHANHASTVPITSTKAAARNWLHSTAYAMSALKVKSRGPT